MLTRLLGNLLKLCKRQRVWWRSWLRYIARVRSTITSWYPVHAGDSRLLGRRSFEQLTPFEMILIFLLGGIGIQTIVSDDRSVINALLAISTIALMHIFVACLKNWSEAFRKFAD